MKVTDRLARPLRDLRLSVTDRCNFRCTYCMPSEVFGKGHAFLQRSALLTFEEIARLGSVFVDLGVEKIRLTGGEPMLRRDLEKLVAMLASIPGLDDLAMTTNGSLLTPSRARVLREAGLRRVTISLDSLDDETFRRMNDVDFPVARVMDALDAALGADLVPVKVDMVVRRGVNDRCIESMAERFRGTPLILRFIEYMDVGTTNEWRLEDVVPATAILERVGRRWPLEPVEPNYPGEVATRYRYVDGQGEIGVIASVTRPFCGGCTRLRLSADGQLYTCLFGSRGHDLRRLLRAGADDVSIRHFLEDAWRGRDDRYSELRHEAREADPKVEMSRIGG